MAEEEPTPQNEQPSGPAPAPPPEPLPTRADPRLVEVKEYSEHAVGQQLLLTGDGTPRGGDSDE